MGLYIAVIADVIDSRNIVDMPEMSEALSAVNAQKEAGILIPFKCLRGDEIEAV